MNDTTHPDPLGHAADGVTAASEALIEQRERARAAHRDLEEAHTLMLGLMGGHLHAFLKVGDVVTKADRELTLMMRVTIGHAHGGTRFKLNTAPRVFLDRGRDPVEANWAAMAYPLRADGTPMSGSVTISAPMFPMPDPSETLQGPAYRAFCDAFVDNWMCSTPETYQRLKPSQFTATQE